MVSILVCSKGIWVMGRRRYIEEFKIKILGGRVRKCMCVGNLLVCLRIELVILRI